MQQLGDDEEMLAIVEEVKHAQEGVLVVRVGLCEHRQHSHLAQPRVKILLAVLEDLDADGPSVRLAHGAEDG